MQDDFHPTLILQPIRAAAPADGGMLEVLLRLQAPDRPAEERTPKRPPLRLALVVDRSGSMSGEPLAQALQCVEYIAAGLEQADQLAVVLYDDQVQVPVPLCPGGDAAAVRKTLAGVKSGGTTALFDGWEAAAKILEGGDRGLMSRVILLSDGQANHGLCDQGQIEQHCGEWAARGVTTTTVGLGQNFNEELMIGMARAGAGQHYYGQTAQDLHDSFDEELALLQSLYLRGVRVTLSPGAGVIAEPLRVFRQSAEGGYALPDLAWGAEAWMIVRLHIAPQSNSDPRQPQPLLAAVVQALDGGGNPISPLHQVLSLPLVSAADLTGMPQDQLVARRLKELQFAHELERIRAFAATGDLAAAKRRLRLLESEVADQPWLAERVEALKSLMQRDTLMSIKEMRYSASRNSARLVQKDETGYRASETDSTELPAFLRRKSSEGKGRRPKQQ